MGSLGSFGTPDTGAAEEKTFDYFDVTLRVDPDIVDADMIDWVEEMGELDESDPRAGTAVKDLMRRVVLADDFDLFWSTAKRHKQSIDQRMTVIAQVVAAISKHPTSRPSDSSGGPERTVLSSPADFALAAQRRLERDGRPDLAVAALRHREYRERLAALG